METTDITSGTTNSSVLMIRTKDGAVYTITKSLLEAHCRNRDIETLASKTALDHMFKGGATVGRDMELALFDFDQDGDMILDEGVVYSAEGAAKGNQFMNAGNQFSDKGNQFANKGNQFSDKGNQFASKGNQFSDKGNQFANKGNQFSNKGDQLAV